MNFQSIFESFLVISFLSILLERFLALFFEQRNIANFLKNKNLKEFIAFGISCFICYAWRFDVVSRLLGDGSNTWNFGYWLTAGMICGGSKVSISLFRNYLSAYKEQKDSLKP